MVVFAGIGSPDVFCAKKCVQGETGWTLHPLLRGEGMPWKRKASDHVALARGLSFVRHTVRGHVQF
jgi:hypothetical protein